MNIHVLGTAAFERVPALFCKCTVCEHARRAGGKNVRSQTQVLIDDDLLVDFGQDNHWHALHSGRDFTKIRYLLLTHSHGDHFMPGDLAMTNRSYGINDIDPPIVVCGNEECKEGFDRITRSVKAEYRVLKPYQTYQLGDYVVTPLPAIHGTKNPLFYVIQKNGKSLLYNLDTELIKDEVYDFIKEKQFVFDAVLCDCTYFAIAEHAGAHMSLPEGVQHRERLLSMGAIRENTKWMAVHFSHNALHKGEKPLTVAEIFALADSRNGAVYSAEEMEQICQSHGMLCAYDGMQITI